MHRMQQKAIFCQPVAKATLETFLIFFARYFFFKNVVTSGQMQVRLMLLELSLLLLTDLSW